MNIDGFWFKEYERSDWVKINNFMVLSSDSCYVDGGSNVFCVIRVNNGDELLTHQYLGCILSPSINDEIGVIVFRRDLRQKDEWHNGEFTLKNIQGISEAIQIIRNIAHFNSYLTEPPYVSFMLNPPNS
jgi:hypothetical protein